VRKITTVGVAKPRSEDKNRAGEPLTAVNQTSSSGMTTLRQDFA